MAITTKAEKAAEAVLAEHWGGKIPVDPIAIARKYGIEVRDAYLDADVSGAIAQRDATTKIYLAVDDPVKRKRFTCAHELGHFIDHQGKPGDLDYVDYRNDTSSKGVDDDERFANAFAAALLMPQAAVAERYAARPNEEVLAKEFRVSQAAMVNRLKNLGLYRR